MEAAELADMPLLEQDLPLLLDERVIAAEETKRDGRETPTRQTPVIQSAAQRQQAQQHNCSGWDL